MNLTAATLRSAEQLNGANILPYGQDSAALRPLVGEPHASRAAPQVGVSLISRPFGYLYGSFAGRMKAGPDQ